MQLKVYIPSNHFPLQAIQNDFIWFHILSNPRMYVGNLGLPESLLNSWYLYVIFVPIFGGCLLISSVIPDPTSN